MSSETICAAWLARPVSARSEPAVTLNGWPDNLRNDSASRQSEASAFHIGCANSGLEAIPVRLIMCRRSLAQGARSLPTWNVWFGLETPRLTRSLTHFDNV